ncbi:MAG TPA: UbiA-like polyprenyltransferase [Puia sp.]|nr:UbiA-like polyprenyltransferase [Puia sp.]
MTSSSVRNYFSLIKFSHTIFAMPFAMIGFFLGVFSTRPIAASKSGSFTPLVKVLNSPFGEPPAHLFQFVAFRLGLVILCMVFARSAAMAFNRYLDRELDAKNPRTAVREIPRGIIKPQNALIFVIFSSILFVSSCFFINRICFYLSPVALSVVLGYSYTKRFTSLCHLILGLGLSLAPIGAYLAITGVFAILPILFSLTVIFWVSGFDIIYALQDEEFDQAQRLYSLPAWLGKQKALHVSEFLHLFSFLCVMAAGLFGHLGPWYWIGVSIFTGMLIYQHAIVTPNDLSKINLAFMTSNGIASVVFASFVITDLYLH